MDVLSYNHALTEGWNSEIIVCALFFCFWFLVFGLAIIRYCLLLLVLGGRFLCRVVAETAADFPFPVIHFRPNFLGSNKVFVFVGPPPQATEKKRMPGCLAGWLATRNSNPPSTYLPYLPILTYTQTTVLKSLITNTSTRTSETEPPQPPAYKFAVTSTIIQHATMPSPPHAAAAAASMSPSSNDDEHEMDREGGGGREARRGMHSATGAYWNNAKDGQWSRKIDGKGFDVVISIIWISIV